MELTTSKVKTIIDGTNWLCFEVTPYDAGRVLSEWKDGKEYTLEVKPKRRKRSLDANAYLWVLCNKIAEVIRSTAEEVYKNAIRDVGVFRDVPIPKEDAGMIAAGWKNNGIGWLCLEDKRSYSDGTVMLRFWKGSSVYDTKEMSRLIDWIVEEAQELGIETMPPDELLRLKNSWQAAKGE